MPQPRAQDPFALRQRVDPKSGQGELTIRGNTEIARRVDGDVTVTSGAVLVSGLITGSLYVVGGHVRVLGEVGGDVENLGGVVDVHGVVEGSVVGPRSCTHVGDGAVVGATTGSTLRTRSGPAHESERFDSAGRWRVAAGLTMSAIGVAAIGLFFIGANDQPSPVPGFTVVAIDRSEVQVAGETEEPPPVERSVEPVEPDEPELVEPDATPEPAELGEPAHSLFSCDPSYPEPRVCIPTPPPLLNCDQVGITGFVVQGDDPHNFDTNGDGIGCDL